MNIREAWSNRKYVKQYDASFEIDDDVINQLLIDAYHFTPSKQNYVPYQIFVIGPNKQEQKELIYEQCLKHESNHIWSRGCDDGIQNIMESIKENNKKNPPLYKNIVECSHCLFFTERYETEPTEFQQSFIDTGRLYEGYDGCGHDNERQASLEAGMFSMVFASLCVEKGYDITHVSCLNPNLSSWSKIGLPFINEKPLLIMTIGKSILSLQEYRKMRKEIDIKPNYERIIHF